MRQKSGQPDVLLRVPRPLRGLLLYLRKTPSHPDSQESGAKRFRQACVFGRAIAVYSYQPFFAQALQRYTGSAHIGPTGQMPFITETTTMTTSRRTFVIQSLTGAGALALVGNVQAQAMLADTDPQAVALGYKADGTKTDTKKYPKYAASQNCANCALYQGKATDATGGCPLFGAKKVAGKGWCSAWAKKA